MSTFHYLLLATLQSVINGSAKTCTLPFLVVLADQTCAQVKDSLTHAGNDMLFKQLVPHS